MEGFTGYPKLDTPLQICPYAKDFGEAYHIYACALEAPEVTGVLAFFTLLVAIWFLRVIRRLQ